MRVRKSASSCAGARPVFRSTRAICFLKCDHNNLYDRRLSFALYSAHRDDGRGVRAMNKSRHTRLSTGRSDQRDRLPLRSTRRVLIVAVPPVRTLDVFGPLEVFGDANRSQSDGPTYEINLISGGTDRDVLTHLGTTLRTD